MPRLSTALALAAALVLLLPVPSLGASPPIHAPRATSADTTDVARYATLDQAMEATLAEDATLQSDDASDAFLFGWSVSASGDRVLVGDPVNDNNGLFYTGAAYVFAFDGAQPDGLPWSLEAKLVADDAGSGDDFGWSVSLDGDRALIGAMDGDGTGTAYVFASDGQQWTQQAKLAASDAAAGDDFGWSVSLDGDRALIGAPLDDDNGGSSGSAYVFTFDGATWGQEAKLTASDAAAVDQFGWSVSLDGDRALVGSRFDDDDGSASGSAYVFALDGTSWSQEAKLTASDAGTGDSFGTSVSLSGDRALVGSPLEDAGIPSNGTLDAGAAYVFAFDGQQWAQQAKLVSDDPRVRDNLGGSASLVGDRALVGAPYDDNDGFGTPLFGRAYLFAFDGAAWRLETSFTPNAKRFGASVSLATGRAAVGAPGDFGTIRDPDAAYVYELAPALAADAGPDQTVVAGSTVTLDGTGSTGAATFAWTLSGATLSGADTATPTFCAATPGSYTAELVVSGDGASSAPDVVTVTALSATDALGALVGEVVATGLSRGQARLLVAELKKAQRALARGQDPSPFLSAFRAQVLDFESQGVLTVAAAGELVASVDAISEALADPCSESTAPPLASATASPGSELMAYPNPSSGRTTVAFSVETAGTVRLSVIDALGREVAVLVNGAVTEGHHHTTLDAAALPAGTYLVRLATADGHVATQRLTRLR